jgi:hypothetical protein
MAEGIYSPLGTSKGLLLRIPSSSSTEVVGQVVSRSRRILLLLPLWFKSSNTLNNNGSILFERCYRITKRPLVTASEDEAPCVALQGI